MEDWDQARSILFEHMSSFGAENGKNFAEEAARIQSMIFEKMEEDGLFSIKDMDLGDTPYIEI